MLRRTLTSLMAAVVATAGLGAFATATATADTEHQNTWEKKYWQDKDDGDAGGISISERAHQVPATGQRVDAHFQALGENLIIQDGHDNDRAAVAKLWVGGNGPAVFYGKGDGTERIITRLSYAEGQTVHLQVCTSDAPNAVCTAKEKHPGRT